MHIKVRKNNDKISADEIKYATKWFAEMLMSPKMIKTIDILIANNNDDGLKGSTECYDDGCRTPRTFTIRIDSNLSRKNQLLTLAHEMVHVKQFANGEMKDHRRNPDVVRWNKQSVNCEQTEYWDLPWEIEAYGREYGLYIRYTDHLRKQSIVFPE
jgi:Zn-dependent peptidase ImmA (M78 family)